MIEYRFAGMCTHSTPKTVGGPNEDAFVTTPSAIVVADGATAKSIGASAPPPVSAGEVARLVAEKAAASQLNGPELVAELNKAVARLASARSSQPSSCTLACVRLVDASLIITIVGDTSVRINGPSGMTYCERMIIDDLTSAARAHYIALTGDVDGSRDFIMPLLSRQSTYRNNDIHPLGYGIIDGTETPMRFVRTITLPLESSDPWSVEVFTDGYAKLPDGVDIADWEQAFTDTMAEDPDRCRSFPSTKSKDDRTIVTARVEAHLN